MWLFFFGAFVFGVYVFLLLFFFACVVICVALLLLFLLFGVVLVIMYYCFCSGLLVDVVGWFFLFLGLEFQYICVVGVFVVFFCVSCMWCAWGFFWLIVVYAFAVDIFLLYSIWSSVVVV